jgi:hypothetical protein
LFKPLNVFGCSNAVEGEVKVIDRASIGVIKCILEGCRARVELKKGLNARSVQTGYGRLFFRQGRGWSAGLKHLSIESKNPATISISMSLREVVGLAKNFYGVVCVPMAKIDIPHGWLIMLAPIYNTPLIEVSKPVLTADRVSVQASLSVGDGGLRYSLNAYGSGFRRAGLELTRHVYTGWSTAFGREKITASEKLAEAWPGENIQSTWKPVKRFTEPILIAMNSTPSRNDVVKLLQSLGCLIHNVLLLGPRLLHSPFIVGDRAKDIILEVYIFGRVSLYFSILIFLPSGCISHVIQQSSIGL